tara:strand:- start:3309 stop:3437 length:129 start_codon:yes stop_codon:yes gene_type:complete
MLLFFREEHTEDNENKTIRAERKGNANASADNYKKMEKLPRE